MLKKLIVISICCVATMCLQSMEVDHNKKEFKRLGSERSFKKHGKSDLKETIALAHFNVLFNLPVLERMIAVGKFASILSQNSDVADFSNQHLKSTLNAAFIIDVESGKLRHPDIMKNILTDATMLQLLGLGVAKQTPEADLFVEQPKRFFWREELPATYWNENHFD